MGCGAAIASEHYLYITTVVAAPYGGRSHLCSIWWRLYFGRHALALAHRFRAADNMGCAGGGRFPPRHGHYHGLITS